MLYWALVCLILASGAAILSFGATAGVVVWSAKLAMVVFIVGFLVSVMHMLPKQWRHSYRRSRS
jgi:uncharacterized membrane protein YtjA (UPF0391 family)